MLKSLKKGVVILTLISLTSVNIISVKADELIQLEDLSEATIFANLSSLVEEGEGEVLGAVKMEESEDEKLVIIDTETEEELIFGSEISITKTEYEELAKIIQAEAGNQDLEGKVLIGNVIMNRVNSDTFTADNIHDVIFASGQFSPVSSGRFFRAVPTDEVYEAIELVLDGVDYSRGALYFNSLSGTSNRTFLFKHGGHKFYK